jgi:hypothetical protein
LRIELFARSRPRGERVDILTVMLGKLSMQDRSV